MPRAQAPQIRGGRNRRFLAAPLAALTLLLAAAASLPATAQTKDTPGAVYTQTNSPGANSIVVFPRTADGSLGAPQLVTTGGAGTGGGLGNQGAVVLSDD